MAVERKSEKSGTSVAKLGAAVAAVFLVATFGSQFAPGDWYAQLAKPSWTPPGWLFGPVWTVLYLLMAIAAWLVWREPSPGRGPALALFGFQLVLNGAWSWLFFGLRRPDLALVDIAALWLAIIATLFAFRRVRPRAALLLAPYLAWVSFATALNWQIWRLN